jgi:hypothetical protein
MEEASCFTKENLKNHMNDMKGLTLAQKEALHSPNFTSIRHHGCISEEVLK